MSENKSNQKSFIEQIYDKMFKIIEKENKFNENEIEILKDLAYKDNFKKANLIIKAIKLGVEKENEINGT